MPIFFLTEGESAENIASKRVDLIAKYSDAIPVELVTVSDFRTYEVLLSLTVKRYRPMDTKTSIL